MAGNQTTSSGDSTASADNDLLFRLTIAAFVTSIAAFVLSSLQALLAYLQFDNSELGRRRCSEEVMGKLWAQKTTSKFKWRGFRYQVFFEVPVFYTAHPGITVGPLTLTKPKLSLLDVIRQQGDVDSKEVKSIEKEAIAMEIINLQRHVSPIYKITGTERSYENTMTRYIGKDDKWANVHTAEDEGCSWVLLLDALQGQEKTSRAWDKSPSGGLDHTISYLIQRKKRCWDFMPLNSTKPFATTTICHLVEIMSMLGLVWTEFDVKASILTAEGNGYMLKSEYLQGLGVLTRFSRLTKPLHEGNRIIPCAEIKRLCFGEVPSLFDSIGQKLRVGPRQLEACLAQLLPDMDVKQRTMFLSPKAPAKSPIIPNTFEIIAMVGCSAHIPHSKFRRLPNPCADPWVPILDIATCLSVFSTFVKGYPNLERDTTTTEIKGLFEHGRLDGIVLDNGQPLIQKINNYRAANDNLARQRAEGTLNYIPLDEVAERPARLQQALETYDDALLDLLDSLHVAVKRIDDRLEVEKVREVLTLHFKAKHDSGAKLHDVLSASETKEKDLISFYFENIQPIVAKGDLRQQDTSPRPSSAMSTASTATTGSSRTNLTPAEVERNGIWLALMFKMWSWFFLHDFSPLDKMIERSEYMNSRLPVYIG